MPSTETKHLTTLNFDITQMEAQLRAIPASVEQAAKAAQDAWNQNFSVDGSGVKGGATGGAAGSGSATDKVTKVAAVTKAQLESLTLAYKNFETVLSRTTTNPEAISKLRTEVKQARDDLAGLTKSLDANGKITGANAKSYHTLSSGLKRAKGDVADLKTHVNDTAGAFDRTGKSIEETGTGLKNFMGKLSDKARWLGAFYLIQGVINGFKALISTVKETETSVVELQRVLSEDVTSPEISSQLYDIAYEYGRTFDEVQESAVLFAQTGKSWNDVLTLTRGTMLALNTAELDVTQATQGLIAIMAQWKLGAEDYVGLIDKINKTADDYAITSEAIVEAMKRSSSTAQIYGMTLEELIGVITALGEATGRSGENLGTAINSLMIYTTRAKSIDVLKKMKIDAEDAEGNLRPVLDIWAELAQKIKGGDTAFADFMANDQEAIGTFLAESEEYKAAVDETIKNGKDVQDAMSIAGTYRRNYFIALLDNLTTAEEAVQNMTDSEGYSVTENEKYMATLAAISNQLSASWKQLAVEFGDASFLKFLKWVTDLGIGIAKLIGNTGGLTTALFTVLGIMIMIKQEQISEAFLGIGRAIKTVTTGANAAGKAVTGLQAAFGWIGLVMTAISLLVSAISGANASAEEAIRLQLEAGEAASQNTKSINDLVTKYIELANSSDFASGNETALTEAKSIHEDIIALLGDQAKEWDLVNGKVDENIKKLRAAQLEAAKTDLKNIEDAAAAANKDLFNPERFSFGEIWNLPKGILGEDSTAEIAKIAKDQGADAAIAKLQTWADEFRNMGAAGVEAYGAVNAVIARYQEKVDAATSANEKLAEQQALIETWRVQEDGLITTQAEFDNYIEILNQAEIQERVTAEYADALREAIAALYPEFSDVTSAAERLQEKLGDLTLDETLNTAELAAAAFKDTQDQVNEFASSMDALNGVVSEYNETGIMTTEMLNSLLGLSSEYLALLDVTSGGLSVNKDATDDLIESKQDLIKAMIDEKFYMEAAAIASEYAAAADKDKWAADVLAASGARELGGSMWDVVSGAASAATSVEGATASIYNALIGMGYASSQAAALAAKLGTVAFAYRNVSAAASGLSLGAFGGASATTPKSSGGGGGGGEDPQIKILEDRKKAIEETAQAQIDALKEVQEAEDRKRRRDDYLADKSEALADVRRAQSRSGIEAREDEANAEKKLAEVNSDWQEQLQDWNLDDQIASIEAWKDAMVDAIDAQLDALKDAGGGGGGGGGSVVSDVMSAEATALQTDLNAVLGVLAQVDSENLPEKLKEFYDLFNASSFTEDVDFAEQLNGIKADLDTFVNENGDKFVLHFNTVLDDGTSLSDDDIAKYAEELMAGGADKSDIIQRDADGYGILLRVTPVTEENEDTYADLEQQYSDVINALGESIGNMLDLAEFGDLDLTETQAAIENAFGASFEIVEQSATATGDNVQNELTTAMDDSGAGMLSSVNLYAPQIADAWKQGAINPMIAGLGDLSTALDDVLLKLGSVASFNGFGGLGGIGATTNNTTQSQVNIVKLNGSGTSQVSAFSGWMQQLK